MVKKRTLGCIFAKTGGGKSYLAKTKIIPVLPRPVFIVDPHGEYNGGVIYHTAKDIANDYNRNESGIYILRPDDDKSVTSLCAFIFGLNQNSHLIVEEADMYCTPSHTDPELDRLIRYGRHKGVSVIFLSRRPAEISRNATAQADWITAFKITEPRDLEYMKSVGIDTDIVSKLEKQCYTIKGELPEYINL